MVAAAATPETATISSGTIFVSTTGEPVHAHGAGIILPDTHPAGAGGKYYMVGATQKTQPGWLSEGINMYSSFDLQHWKFEHEIFHNTSITTPLPEGEIPYYRIERPKVRSAIPNAAVAFLDKSLSLHEMSTLALLCWKPVAR